MADDDHLLDVLIVGAGPGGLCTAVFLREHGIHDFVLLERSDGIGGTWHNNRYPGLACDVISDHYCFSFFQDWDWPRAYSRPAEIVEYLEATVDRYGLRPMIRTGTRVEEAVWSSDRQVWRVTDEHGVERGARFLVGAVGMFNEVVKPDIAGLDRFAGPVVHTAEWPENDAPLIEDRTVAVIGSAASAVQLVPAIAPAVTHLVQFQRTPNWVFPKDDVEFTLAQIAARRHDVDGRAAARARSFDLLRDMNDFNNAPLMAELGKQALDNLCTTVEDESLREALVPRLPLGSQRPLQSSDYYEALNRDDVTLVTSPIERVTTDGILTADGRLHRADTIVLATGYAAHKFFSVVRVVGRDGVALAERWAEGAYAYKGMALDGFPNLFMLYGPNTNGGSIIDKLEIQARYIAAKIGFAAEHGVAALEVTPEAVTGYDDRLQALLDEIRAFQVDGSHYYRAPSGRVVTQCPYNVSEYEALTLVDDLDDYVLAPAAEDVR